ncbi:hypothetical protein L3Q82_005232 [Scortum barcoo]|uniref:Uncharacterized protein n=1 Tax=Scortum barcoo TaxID=214431 RepID=A0ACB8V9D0_9TELE|nr:hypothetical protein L3Q82_005232 [Scortum barcoo]
MAEGTNEHLKHSVLHLRAAHLPQLIMTGCFERIVLKHIKDIIPAGLDQYQFTYRENRLTEDAVSIALHTDLTHLQLPNTYVRMLFVDFSSAFNTVREEIQHHHQHQQDQGGHSGLQEVQQDRAHSSLSSMGKQLSVSTISRGVVVVLGIHITSDLTWSMNTAHLVKKAQQRLSSSGS